MKSAVCLSADLSIFFFGGKNRQIWNLSTCRQMSRFVFFQQIVDLVQIFYVGSPLGDLNPSLFPEDRKTHHPVAGSPAKNTEFVRLTKSHSETEIRFPWRQKGFPPRIVFRSTNSHKISYDLHIRETRREGSLPPPLIISDFWIQHETIYPLDE